MEKVSRKVEIKWKYNPTAFELVNKDVMGEVYRRIGGSRSGINRLLEQSAMLQKLMPQVLGVSPDSKDVNWEKTVREYWNSLTVEVDSTGKPLETGFIFDINDVTRKEYIDELRKKVATAANTDPFKTSKDLADYVMGYISDKADTPKIPEGERWKYGTPINVEEYLLYRYVENYADVANKVEDINKSANIRFFLSTEDDKKRISQERNKSKSAAIKAYNKFIQGANEEDYNDLLCVFNPYEVKEIVTEKSYEDKQTQVMDLMSAKPKEFANAVNNKSLSTIAKINKYIAFGIFKRLTNTSTIVDATDPQITIGNNQDECISFMNNKKNEVKLNEYEAKFKASVK